MKYINLRKTRAAIAALSMTALFASFAADEHVNRAQTTLRDAFKDDFLIGVAVNQAQFSEEDTRGAAIAKAQFNSVSPENILKWESVHPTRGEYAFTGPDRYVAFGEKNKMFIIGHTLVWHNQ